MNQNIGFRIFLSWKLEQYVEQNSYPANQI